MAETTIIAGTGVQTGTAYRWGDYSSLSVDPTDDWTFWYTTEYIQTTGIAPWRTRVAAFKFPPSSVGWVQGTVTNSSGGAPVSGVAVDFVDTVAQAGAITDTSGSYLVNAVIDTPNTTRNVTLRARKFGFLAYQDTITIVLDDTVTRNISLTPAPTGTLLVHAFRNDSSGIRANVRVTFGGTEVVNDFTDSLTGLLSAPLPDGTYDVVIDPPSPYGTRSFSGVGIVASQTTNVDALVRFVVEPSPTAMRDTLAFGQVHAQTLTLTNTTGDSISFLVLDDVALTMMAKRTSSRPSVMKTYSPYELPKGSEDPNPGWSAPQGRGGPDSFGYEWIDSDEPGGPTFSWVDISATGTALDSTSAWIPTGTFRRGDEGYYPVALPFSFPYYGVLKDSLFIGTNGNVMFQRPTGNAFTNSPFPTAGGVIDNHTGIFWDDQEVRAGARVYFGVNGSDFVVQYQGMARFGGMLQNYTYEIILKPNGQWLCQYLSMGFNGGTVLSATIGMENATGTVGLTVVHNAAYMHNNLAVLFSRPDALWLSENPTQGILPPNGSQDITVTFDASGLTVGTTYNANILIGATHPDAAGRIPVAASLNVVAADSAVLVLSRSFIPFPPTEITTTRTDSLTARNGGALTLNISSIGTTNTDFSVSPANASIAPGDSIHVIVDYSPTSIGPDTGRIIFLSNSQGTPRIDVLLSGTAIGIAHIQLQPTTFTFDVNATNDTTTQSLTIANPGTDTLRYAIREVSATLTSASSPSIEKSREQQLAYDLPKGSPDPNSGSAQLNGRGGPDAFGYIWIDSDEPGGPAFGWVDITGVGTQIAGLGDDTNLGPYPIGFNFSFYGNSYSQIRVCSNGFVSFTSTSTAFTNVAIPAAAAPNDALYAFWDDLNFALGGTAHYYYDATNNNFTVQYTNVPFFSGTGTNTFQVILKPNGDIRYQYLSMTGAVNSATIGIENVTGTVALQVVFNAAYLHDNLAILLTTDLFPWLSTDGTTGTIAPDDSQSVQVRVHPGFGFPPGSHAARLRVTGNSPDTAHATVNMNVTLPDTTFVQVTSPNGGEQWVIGQTYNITWTANQVNAVRLEYSLTGSGGPWTLIADSIPALSSALPHPKLRVKNIGGGEPSMNLGSYPFTVPNSPTTNGYVRVTDTDSASIFDTNDGPFSIITAPPDTGRWVSLPSPTGATLYSVSMGNDTSVVWVAGAGGVVSRSTNGGFTWLSGSVGIDVYNIFAVDANTALVASDAASNARILRTTNAGTSWQVVFQSTNPAAFIDGIWMFDAANGYAFGDPTASRWMLLRTADGGATWDSTGLFLPQAGSEAGWNNSWWWLNSQYGWFGTNNTRVYKSTDGGVTWTFGATPFLNSYSVAFANSLLGLAGGSAGGQMARSTDGGATWTSVAPAGGVSVLCLAALDLSPPRWYAGGSGGIYKTTNHGTSWTLNHARTGLNHVVMKIAQVGGNYWVCGYAVGGSGAISKYMENLGPVSVPISSEIPAVFALEQNYPNPFNPTTSIRYALPVDAGVKLTIFNVLGQEVATLVNGEQQQAGYFEVLWDGKNAAGAPISSGVYFFRIDATPVNGATHFTQIRKMLMIK